ncbi:MAG: tRNA 2-thiouridine(34) synthase MnmA [Planctomycetes bacterium]|nr:tRNA 2-thiouridine(34) synthase MnmA [Planctomycetota bacterium]
MSSSPKTQVGVLLSGGVDSAVALRLLVEQEKYDIRAYYLKIWLEDELAYLGECPWEEDLNYARQICEQCDVPLEIINLQSEYLDRVVDLSIRELKAGRTPSPDIHCNERIKFGAFFEKLSQGVDKVASGHYARVEENSQGLYELKRAPDPVKDQTYFLSNLSQSQLSKILFPIGHLQKKEVRELAAKFDLASQSRKDSQGICFLGKIPYREFVQHHLGVRKGDIIEWESGEKKGEHQGYWFHTIGQRKGLGLGQGPWFVVHKDSEKNIVYISHQNFSANQAKSDFKVHQVNWISGTPSHKSKLQCKLRHGPELIDCDIVLEEEGLYQVHIQSPDQGVAPGQHAIFYDGEVCLGGGMIV